MRSALTLLGCVLLLASGQANAVEPPALISTALTTEPTQAGNQVTVLHIALHRDAIFAADSTATRVRITGVYRNKKGETVADAGWTSDLLLPTTTAIAARWAHRTALPPGEVRVGLFIHVLEHNTEQEVTVRGEIPDLSQDAFPVSDLILGWSPDPGDSPEGDWVAATNGLLDAMKPGIGVLWIGGSEAQAGIPLTETWKLRLDRGGEVARGSEVLTPAGWMRRQVTLPLAELSSGSYLLELELTSAAASVRRAVRFRLGNGQGIPLDDPVKMRVVLGYVATNEERRTLEVVPDGELPAFWKEFWARRNPNSGGTTNPAMESFLQRVEFAEHHLGGSVPGWETDRGRIHILYGEADRYETEYNDSGVPGQIWYYYERNVVFLFQDRTGFGDYRLAGSERR